MGFSLERQNRNGFVERNASPGEQLRFRFDKVRHKEEIGWGELLQGVKRFGTSDWAKVVAGGVLIGAAWYWKGRQKAAEFLEDGGKRLLKDALRNAWKGFKPKHR